MELLFVRELGLLLQDNPVNGVVVTLDKPESELARLSDVLIGSLGLSGVLAIAALLIGIIAGGLVFWLRSRREATEDAGRLRL
jgi:hypothetical protein